MTISLDFTGKVVVVVGGTSGINRGIAKCFATHGAKVAVASRRQEKVDETVKELTSLGADATGFAADVREPNQLEAGMQTVHERFGDFDVVVSGAAGNFPALANDLSWNGFKSVVDIDLRGTFHVMKAIFPRLRKPGASVINISAPQSFLPMKAQVHVCAAKAGVDMITRTLCWNGAPVVFVSILLCLARSTALKEWCAWHRMRILAAGLWRVFRLGDSAVPKTSATPVCFSVRNLGAT